MNPTNNPIAIQSQKMITDAFIQLMKVSPYEEISVKQIILESTLTKKTFYRNFSSKEDVLFSYLDSMITTYAIEVLCQEDSSILHMFDFFFDFCEKNKAVLLMLKDSHLLPMLLYRLNQLIPKIHNEQRKALETKETLLSDYMLAFNIGACWNVLIKWIEHDMMDSSEEIKKVLINYLAQISSLEVLDI